MDSILWPSMNDNNNNEDHDDADAVADAVLLTDSWSKIILGAGEFFKLSLPTIARR